MPSIALDAKDKMMKVSFCSHGAYLHSRGGKQTLNKKNKISLAANNKCYEKNTSRPVCYTKETRTERDMCTPMFITALFTVARTWKQPRCPSADEWTRKLWYMYTMKYYSAIKRMHLSQF